MQRLKAGDGRRKKANATKDGTETFAGKVDKIGKVVETGAFGRVA